MALWFELVATTPPELVDAVTEALMAASPSGVAVEEPVDILGPERGFRVRGGEPVILKAYVPSGEVGAVLVDDLRHAMGRFPEVELIARPVYEEDWSTSWREFFGVVETGGRIVVVPSWIDFAPGPGQIAIRVDPGQAFGTGHHETTRLCLCALEDRVAPGIEFLDLGTGSGILSIAAIKLGAASGDAIDIDAGATAIAAANLAANGAGERVAVRAGTLSAGGGRTYDLIVANIFADPLIALAPVFAEAVRPGGWLILSGILATDAARVRGAMESRGFEQAGYREERDWCAIEFERPSP